MKAKTLTIAIILLIVIVGLISFSPNHSNELRNKLNSYNIENAFPELVFTSPMDFQDPRDVSGRVFVVEQTGIIKIFYPICLSFGRISFIYENTLLKIGTELNLSVIK